MRILAIGNSFSMDANTYIHQMAAAAGADMEAWNLYIGGCSLERHWKNVLGDRMDYELQVNGDFGLNKKITVRSALQQGPWDVVTLQQASHFSGMYGTYQPYLNVLAKVVREHAPAAKLMIHETWAYEKDSRHPAFPDYGCDQKAMHDALKDAYERAAADIGVPVIRCGDAVQAARGIEPFIYEKGGISLCRDGFHMSLIYGRYLLAAVWVETLTGMDLTALDYLPPELDGVKPDAGYCAVLRRIAHETVTK